MSERSEIEKNLRNEYNLHGIDISNEDTILACNNIIGFTELFSKVKQRIQNEQQIQEQKNSEIFYEVSNETK